MKLVRCFLALMLGAFGHQSFAQAIKLLLPETNTEITVTLRHSAKVHGDFGSLTILANGKLTRFVPNNPVLRIPNTPQTKLERGVFTDIAGLNVHTSRFFLPGSYTVDSHPHTLLFFLSEGGIGAAPVFVVGFSDDGQPYKVLERSELDVTSLENTKDSALIVGKTSLSEVMGGEGGNGSKKPYATTYDPFSVYVVHPSSPAAYSLSATRTYNQKHYVWAGPRVREDYGVLYNMPGHAKPFGAPASKVDSLLGLTGGK